jgi:MFS family permease
MPSSPFEIPGFRRLLISRFICYTAKQIRMLTVMWQIWELTHRPIMLGLVGLAEGIPFIAASLFAGNIADRRERRSLLLIAYAGLAACTVGLAALSALPTPSSLAIYGLLGISALFSSLEMPTASAYLGTIVPRDIFPRAAALNLTTYVTATIIGPIAAGFLIKTFGPTAVYAIAAAGLGAAFVIALPLPKLLPPVLSQTLSTVAAVKDGLKFVTSRRIIFASMILDSFSVLFGEVVFVLPIFADMLGVGPVGLGFLRAAPAMGSCLVSLREAHRPTIRIRWDWLIGAVTVFGLALICFGLSRWFPLSMLLLVVAGGADGTSVIIRQSLYQAFTPDAYRGRVASVSGIFISASNEIGGFESGLAAQLMGTVPSVVFGGVVTLCTVAFMRWKFPKLDEEAARAA